MLDKGIMVGKKPTHVLSLPMYPREILVSLGSLVYHMSSDHGRDALGA
jgi:hypothetical protein